MPPLRAPLPQFVMRRVHQHRQRHLEDLGHFGVLALDAKAFLEFAHHRCDQEPRRRKQRGVGAQDMHEPLAHADFFMGFTQCRRHYVGIERLDAPSWKTHLPRMMMQVFSAAREQHVQALGALHQRHEDGGRAGTRMQGSLRGEGLREKGLDLPGGRFGERLADGIQGQRARRQPGERCTGHHRLNPGIERGGMKRGRSG
ncbi:hypothetical protein CDEF62S_00894 [Castellaniella defragrans]